jgi:NAD+ dependent glucose-6-phosphate dehydrogenase
LKKTVLITGAGGLIGTLLRQALSEKYNIRALSLEPIPGVETIVTDIVDMDAMLAACQGVDSVIHLAASVSMRAPWDDVLNNNIIGAYTVFEAACRAGVRQIIFASSNHAVGTYDLENAPDIYHTGQPLIDHLVPVRPDGYYGVSKCFGETLGRYYADHRGMHVLCLRIGAVNRLNRPVGGRWEPLERGAAIWLSHRDLVQLVEKCLEAEDVKFDIFYGISNNTPRFYDLEHAREVLGYEPQDSAAERLKNIG